MPLLTKTCSIVQGEKYTGALVDFTPEMKEPWKIKIEPVKNYIDCNVKAYSQIKAVRCTK